MDVTSESFIYNTNKQERRSGKEKRIKNCRIKRCVQSKGCWKNQFFETAYNRKIASRLQKNIEERTFLNMGWDWQQEH